MEDQEMIEEASYLPMIIYRDQISSLSTDLERIPKLESDLAGNDQLEKFLFENNSILQRVFESIDRVVIPVGSTFQEPVEKLNFLAGYVANEHNILCREVEIVDGPFVIKLSLELDVIRREVEIQFETASGPFVVKLSLDLNIIRREVEIQACVVLSPISFVVKLKLALKLGNCLLTANRPFAVKLRLCCLESNILRCELNLAMKLGSPFVVKLSLKWNDILRRGVEIVDVWLSLDLNILRREVEIQVLYVAGGHDSLRREVETVDDPFIVKFFFELDILRREVEIYSRANCVVSSPISFTVKLKLDLKLESLLTDTHSLSWISFVVKLKFKSGDECCSLLS
ncbi:hypothetical protein F3Y22_tig00112699pilonHSYRG00063 [Hibiscus syriacus]|uniref:Uncharacterized protein n=1 Tax=Hibiscus syriacus TaxID=106335 RepID=A0A6A2X7I4_HIBSY|nr:hypothetical protein F3Y22_tig00112699pilonHSYRG00063 [Hibiscus syriacus]